MKLAYLVLSVALLCPTVSQAAIGFDQPMPVHHFIHPDGSTNEHHINVDGKLLADPLDVIYRDGKPLVALRAVANELGYQVSWNPKEHSAIISTSISKIIVKPNESTVIRNGLLKYISLDTSLDTAVPAEIYQGRLYVDPEVFTLGLNEVDVMDHEIYIAPQRAYPQ